MKLQFGARTIEGRRPINEDAYCVLSELGLYAVADGMGGYEGGEVASRLCIETLAEFWTRLQGGRKTVLPIETDYERSPVENIVAAAIQLANTRIKDQRWGALAQMGTTVATVQIVGEEAVVGHVGDSRVYRLRDAGLERLTRDHSLYEELRASGAIVGNPQEFGHAHVVTRALGLEADLSRPDLKSIHVAVGDTILLCTDGLTDVLSDEDISVRLAENNLEAAAAALVQSAFDAGSRDNITAVLIRRAG